MEPVHYKVTFEGETMTQLTVTFSVDVQQGAATPLTVKDPTGAPLTDGQSVTLSPETVGVQSSVELFTVSGGTAPYNFSVATGQLPPGMSLSSVANADGSETVDLSGTPTTAGTSTFGVLISDSGA
jgi:hypothetical protein